MSLSLNSMLRRYANGRFEPTWNSLRERRNENVMKQFC